MVALFSLFTIQLSHVDRNPTIGQPHHHQIIITIWLYIIEGKASVTIAVNFKYFKYYYDIFMNDS